MTGEIFARAALATTPTAATAPVTAPMPSATRPVVTPIAITSDAWTTVSAPMSSHSPSADSLRPRRAAPPSAGAGAPPRRARGRGVPRGVAGFAAPPAEPGLAEAEASDLAVGVVEDHGDE